MRLVVPLLLAAAGCATSSSSWSDELDRELAGRTAGEPERCLPATAAQGLAIAGPDAVALRQGRTIWVSRLERDCPGFAPLATLIVEVHGGRYCSGDRVRAREPGLSIPGPYCRLGDFVPWRKPR